MQAVKLFDIRGNDTIGFGESRIKFYSDDRDYYATLYSGRRRIGRIHFNSIDKIIALSSLLGNEFRVTPSKG